MDHVLIPISRVTRAYGPTASVMLLDIRPVPSWRCAIALCRPFGKYDVRIIRFVDGAL